ncbi:hypothetical protein PYW07_002457 [Mythimna separata]|uniref:Lipase domain-containing protein n=1 Tax=Mythimna separata TaxID=271217 RepID=A0AAD7YMB1_MYTSE|nr:hypothetical protein PYW07_002457 [Mythimna separata]
MCSVKSLLFLTVVWPVVFIGLLDSSQAAFLRCYKGSLNHYLETPLTKPLALSSCINTELPTMIYTFGFRGKTAGPATTAVLTAYLAQKKRNVLLLDWEKEADPGLLGISLGYALSAVPSAKKIGKELGQALMDLTKAGVQMEDVHLVGHSLGAHLLGFAGKRARKNGYVVARITGLDPARALFDGPFAVQSGLDRTCAKFVDIIHTDPGGYGSDMSTGTVDIWPNYTGGAGTQAGCPVGKFEQFSAEDLCSHDRSWQYFVESLASPTAFQAAGASNVNEWIASGGYSNQSIYMGPLTSTRATGNFYLRTNSAQPFGLGADGMKPNGTQVRRRRNPLLTRILKYF